MADQEGQSSSSAGEASTSQATTSSTSDSSSSSNTTSKCASCSKPSKEEKPLKPCTKCQSTSYCSRDCQKAHFKQHKKVCAQAAQVYAMNADFKMAAPKVEKKDGFRGGLQKWQFDT